MTEQEEFEFRRRFEQEQAQQYATPETVAIHTGSSSQGPPRQPSQWSDILAGAMQGLSDLGFGAKQRWYELTRNPLADAMRQQVVATREQEQMEAALKGPKSLAFGASEVGAKTLPFMAASFAPGGQTLLGGTALGALQGALEPTASGAETWRNTGLGGVSAAGTSLAFRGVAPRTRIEPERQYIGKAADIENVPLTGGQRTGLEYVQQAEGHGLWNPLTRWHARGTAQKQEDYFVAGLLKRAGVKEDLIPPNPSLSPQMLDVAHKEVGRELDYNFVGKFYTPVELARPFQIATRAQYFSAANPEVQNMVRNSAELVLQLQRAPASVNNFRYRGESIQELLRELKETADELYRGGHKRAGDLIKGTDTTEGLINTLINSLKAPEVYRIADQNYAKLRVIEDTLRASGKGMALGNPNPAALGRVMEREMPGSVIRERSDLADLARVGGAATRSQPLPERVSGLPRFPSDFTNAATYFRFNNPVSRWGFRHPTERDMLETALRYLPYSSGQSDITLEEAKRAPGRVRDWWNGGN